MGFVVIKTSIPVPEILESYVKDGTGYIFMSKAAREPLANMWKDLSAGQRASVVSQLKYFTQQLNLLTGEFYGSLWEMPSEDIFFTHVPFHHKDVQYGPYYSRQQYNVGLVTALSNSRPACPLADGEKALANRLLAVTNETKVFTGPCKIPMLSNEFRYSRRR